MNGPTSYLQALTQRRDYLSKRIAAKQGMDPPWDTQWDIRERDATEWALQQIRNISEGPESLPEADHTR